jgi:hypothetical protein
MVGGTRGATYVYVYDNGFFVNIKHLPQVKLISTEKSGKRAEEIYRAPKELLKNKLMLTFSFGRKSGYPSIHLCVGEQEAVPLSPPLVNLTTSDPPLDFLNLSNKPIL